MSKKLVELLNRLVTDEEYRKKVMTDKRALSEIGWSPKVIAGFSIKDESDYWGCGTICGCAPKWGMGCDKKTGHFCTKQGGVKVKGC